VVMWFKSDEVPTNGICQLIGKTDDPYYIDSGKKGFFIGLQDYSGTDNLVAQVRGATGVKNYTIPINEEEWNFVALVKDTDNNSISLIIGDTTQSDNITIGGSSCSGYQTRLGKDATTGSWQYNGVIDGVRIYNDALSTDQLDELYTEGIW